ncbi:MAG: hypothetical protein EBT92_17830 [Planctomycetes bacterium]|nr:hypothetical protein [Planctomycetota bacterium]
MIYSFSGIKIGKPPANSKDKLIPCKSKGANGAVAVGLPHRNCSVFKHTRIRKDDKCKWGRAETRASEAKGPLPAEEGWVMEKKEKRKRVKEPHPAQWVGLFVFCLWVGLKPMDCVPWVS